MSYRRVFYAHVISFHVGKGSRGSSVICHDLCKAYARELEDEPTGPLKAETWVKQRSCPSKTQQERDER